MSFLNNLFASKSAKSKVTENDLLGDYDLEPTADRGDLSASDSYHSPPYYSNAYENPYPDSPYRRADVAGQPAVAAGYGSPGGYYGSFSGYGHGHHDDCCKKGKGFFGFDFDNNFLTTLIGGFLFLTVFNDFFERLLNRDLDGDGTIGRSMRGGYRLNWDVVPRIGQGRINIY